MIDKWLALKNFKYQSAIYDGGSIHLKTKEITDQYRFSRVDERHARSRLGTFLVEGLVVAEML